MNTYEPDNALQHAYNAAYPGCLCGHFESCPNCNGALDPLRLALEQLAQTLSYTLYLPWDTEKPVRRSVPRMFDKSEDTRPRTKGVVWIRPMSIAEKLMLGFDETAEMWESCIPEVLCPITMA